MTFIARYFKKAVILNDNALEGFAWDEKTTLLEELKASDKREREREEKDGNIVKGRGYLEGEGRYGNKANTGQKARSKKSQSEKGGWIRTYAEKVYIIRPFNWNEWFL
ncbi:uncharacterized protein MONOS_17646 [Monocercomonoides exilis]|uniref:uncharacterized protein n=1 Tax=Monocercomonoides exilis TaxID=2049356 RepID=UPI0035593EAD|nr:hypothetical protein MONOS_17646 [Monocercomonoides exilis]